MSKSWQLKSAGKELYLQFEAPPPFLVLFSTKKICDIHKKLNLEPYVELEQIHSSTIFRVDKPVPPKSLSGDGLITSKSGIFLVVKVADCYPMYVIDPDALACGVFHVGWRGLKEGIVENAIQKFREYFGSIPENLLVIFGPGISAENYEVGEEFRSYFKTGFIERGGKLHFDIYQAALCKLRRYGITEVYGPPYDTYSNPEWFYSKRRDGILNGLNRAIIGFRKELSVHSLMEDSPYNI
ncbi:MAG: polyphenol oxidase family protein [candidate division WOR-3 bacterium]